MPETHGVEDSFRYLVDYGLEGLSTRRMNMKHSIRATITPGDGRLLECTGRDGDGPCGWTATFHPSDVFAEFAERAAFVHISEPCLIIPESSDIDLTKG